VEVADGAGALHPISISTAAHYTWGTGCGGWYLVNRPELSVIQERMPPGTAEARHFHTAARQLFFILSGSAVLAVGGVEWTLSAGESLEVAPCARHQIFNRSEAPLEFLVVSQPHSRRSQDRKWGIAIPGSRLPHAASRVCHSAKPPAAILVAGKDQGFAPGRSLRRGMNAC
jgi:mannose-6-phosphate isomerase-like protein (cupin superfamily)